MKPHFPHAYPLDAILVPSLPDYVGGSLFRVVDFLWSTPLHEVREACFSAIRKADFSNSNFKAFQGSNPDLGDNHKKIQDTVYALLEVDPMLSVALIKEYLKFSHAAYQTDEHYKNNENMAYSKKMHIQAMRFAIRLLVVKRPKGLTLGKLDWNPLYQEPALFNVLVQVVELQRVVGWDADLFLLAASRMLLRLAQKGCITEESWESFERLYRYAIGSFGTLSHDPDALRPRLRKIAQLILEDKVRFMEDLVFGELLAGRAKKVCRVFLESRK